MELVRVDDPVGVLLLLGFIRDLNLRVLLEPLLKELVLVEYRCDRFLLRLNLLDLLLLIFIVFFTVLVFYALVLLVIFPLRSSFNLLSVLLGKLCLSLGNFDIHASYALGLLFLKSFAVLEGALPLSLTVEDVITTSLDAECQPSKEASDFHAALSFNLLKNDAFDVLLNEVQSGIGCLRMGLDPAWMVSNELFNE